MKKRKNRLSGLLLSMTLALGLLFALSMTAYAENTYSIQFSANGNTKIIQNITLPHTFSSIPATEDGELDYIIKELYELSSAYGTSDAPVYIDYSEGENPLPIIVGLDVFDQYITITAPFDGTAYVTGEYYNNDAEEQFSYDLF